MPVILAVLAGIAVALVVYMTARRKKQTIGVADARTPVDDWIESNLTMILSRAVNDTLVDQKRIARALGGDPDPDVVSSIEDAVRDVVVEYVREPNSDVEVRLQVHLENGTTEKQTTTVPFDKLPSSVRSDFERKAVTRVYRPWPLPWMRAS